MQIAETCKIPRKLYKIEKNAKPIFLDSWCRVLQLLLYSPGLILDIFSMKNRNVKNLDLP
jgi:hypothetical protein